LIDEDVIFDDSTDASANLKENNERYDITKVRFFNFSIEKDGTLNLKLNNDIKYFSVDDINLNPSDVASLMEYAGLYMASLDSQGVATYTQNNGSSSFTYTGKEDIQVGDIVAFYEGTKPTDRNPEKGTERKTDNADVSYVKIIRIDGSTYYYVAAEAEDVTFTPDVLPIDVDDNDGTTGWTEGRTSLTIDNMALDKFISYYKDMSDKNDITIDVGDYMVFYTGDYEKEEVESLAYAEIIEIIVDGDHTIIHYEEVDESEVMSAMDLYDETELTESEIKRIINENEKEIQQIIEAQIMDSNFFDKAGEYLVKLTLKTEEVKEVFGDDLTLNDGRGRTKGNTNSGGIYLYWLV